MLPVWTWTSVTASAIGRMLVIASRLAEALMPSSDRLFWISRCPAPRKLRPMSLLSPVRTPGVVLARLQTLRCRTGSSTMARSPTVAEIVARSVFSICDCASTLTASLSAPTCSVAFVRFTWLVASSTPVVVNVVKPVTEIVISYLPGRANWIW